MYIAGFVIPVPEGKKDAYRKWAEFSAGLFKEYGCLDRKSTRLNSSHNQRSRMPSSA